MLLKHLSKKINYFLRSIRYKIFITYLQLFQDTIFDLNTISNLENPLTSLMNKYYSDKGDINQTHNYTRFYDSLFSNIKENQLNIFEVGLGSVDTKITFHMNYSNENYFPLASLMAWRDYFPKSKIFGADIDTKILNNSERINTFFVDMLNKDSIKDMWSEINTKMDIIIDDGFHSYEANINFFENSINFLNKNGFYIIEDIHRKPSNIFKFFKYFKKNKIKFQIIDLKHSSNILDNCLILIKKE